MFRCGLDVPRRRFDMSRRRSMSAGSRCSVSGRRRRRMMMSPAVTTGKGHDDRNCHQHQCDNPENLFHTLTLLENCLPSSGDRSVAFYRTTGKVDCFSSLFLGINGGAHVFTHKLSFVIHPGLVSGEMPPDNGPAVAVVGINKPFFRFRTVNKLHIRRRNFL